ncbi:unnamed protein product [Bursaphelenchus okinawaensis]|uniref:Uncharacterized protein n=1 Tax=Bursaphelenchus okinawaensis TaxID=465554 RepID=A0A811KWT1_9BILA|nr:unnamed protein product [Bursaphelenchus okinawaensis]CAG9112452.1 unnamed protein product [Bursaphelenchus okinawaensis]
MTQINDQVDVAHHRGQKGRDRKPTWKEDGKQRVWPTLLMNRWPRRGVPRVAVDSREEREREERAKRNAAESQQQGIIRRLGTREAWQRPQHPTHPPPPPYDYNDPRVRVQRGRGQTIPFPASQRQRQFSNGYNMTQ